MNIESDRSILLGDTLIEVLLRHRFLSAGWVRSGGCVCGWRSRRPTGPRDLTREEQFAIHVAEHVRVAVDTSPATSSD